MTTIVFRNCQIWCNFLRILALSMCHLHTASVGDVFSISFGIFLPPSTVTITQDRSQSFTTREILQLVQLEITASISSVYINRRNGFCHSSAHSSNSLPPSRSVGRYCRCNYHKTFWLDYLYRQKHLLGKHFRRAQSTKLSRKRNFILKQRQQRVYLSPRHKPGAPKRPPQRRTRSSLILTQRAHKFRRWTSSKYHFQPCQRPYPIQKPSHTNQAKTVKYQKHRHKDSDHEQQVPTHRGA